MQPKENDYVKNKKTNRNHFSSEKNMIALFEKDPIDVWVNSPGGCRTQWISRLVGYGKEPNQSDFWNRKACHYIRPLPVDIQLGVFCYVDDISIALSGISNKLPSAWSVYEKMLPENESGKAEIPYTIEHWLSLISKQIDYWTNNPHFPTLILNTDRLGDPAEFKCVRNILNTPKNYQQWKPRTTKTSFESLAPYQKKIDKINKKLRLLPDLEVRVPNSTLKKLPILL